MLFVDDQPVSRLHNLNAMLGQTLVQRHRRSVGFPLAVAVLSGGVGVWLVVSAVLSWAVSPLLAVASGGIAAAALYLAARMAQDAWRHGRFNHRRLAVHYGLRDVRVRSRDGEVVRSFEDGLDHALAPWVPDGLPRLLQARAWLVDEPADAPIRTALEWAVWVRHDAQGTRPLFVAVPPQQPPYGFGPADRSGIPALRAQGIPVFQLRMESSPHGWRVRLGGDGAGPIVAV